MTSSERKLPGISVLVTCYNCGPYIYEALASVRQQDYKGDMECIVVNDASSDNSHEEIEKFLSEYRDSMDITYIRLQNNSGVAAAMDAAMAQAKYEWFVLADGDDIQWPDRCSGNMELLEQYPGTLMMSTGAQHADQNGTPLDSFQPPFYTTYEESPDVLYLKTPEERAHNWMEADPFPKIIGFQAILHRSLFDKWGRLVQEGDQRFTQDVTWFMRALLTGPVLATRRISIYYRQHSSNYENRSRDKASHFNHERQKDQRSRFRAGAFVSKLRSLERALQSNPATDWSEDDIRAAQKACQQEMDFYNLFTDWWSSSVFGRIRKMLHYRKKVRPVHFRMCFPRLLPLRVFCWLKTLRQR